MYGQVTEGGRGLRILNVISISSCIGLLSYSKASSKRLFLQLPVLNTLIESFPELHRLCWWTLITQLNGEEGGIVLLLLSELLHIWTCN